MQAEVTHVGPLQRKDHQDCQRDPLSQLTAVAPAVTGTQGLGETVTPGPKASSLNSPAVLLRELRLTGRKRGAIKPQAHTVLLSPAVAHPCGPPHSLGRKTQLFRKAQEPRGMTGAQGNASSLGAQMTPSGVRESAEGPGHLPPGRPSDLAHSKPLQGHLAFSRACTHGQPSSRDRTVGAPGSEETAGVEVLLGVRLALPVVLSVPRRFPSS